MRSDLQEGFRRNPKSHEILLELGRLHFERGNYARARNQLELAFHFWKEQELPKPAEKQNLLAVRQVLNYLAVVEDRAGNRDAALNWLEKVKAVSPNPDAIDKRIAEVKAGQSLSAE